MKSIRWRLMAQSINPINPINHINHASPCTAWLRMADADLVSRESASSSPSLSRFLARLLVGAFPTTRHMGSAAASIRFAAFGSQALIRRIRFAAFDSQHLLLGIDVHGSLRIAVGRGGLRGGEGDQRRDDEAEKSREIHLVPPFFATLGMCTSPTHNVTACFHEPCCSDVTSCGTPPGSMHWLQPRSSAFTISPPTRQIRQQLR